MTLLCAGAGFAQSEPAPSPPTDPPLVEAAPRQPVQNGAAAPESSAQHATLSVGRMTSLLTSLEREELVLKRAELINDMPGFGSSIALTITGSVLTVGSAAMWAALGASGGFRALGGSGFWNGLLTFAVVVGVVIASGAGITGIALFFRGRVLANEVEAVRAERMGEVRDLDARIERRGL